MLTQINQGILALLVQLTLEGRCITRKLKLRNCQEHVSKHRMPFVSVMSAALEAGMRTPSTYHSVLFPKATCA